MTEIPSVVEARALAPYEFFVRFDDGMEGTVDLRDAIGGFTGVFAPLADPVEFAKIFVDPESRTVAWPCGVDLDPIVLHWRATGEPSWVADAMQEARPAQP